MKSDSNQIEKTIVEKAKELGGFVGGNSVHRRFEGFPLL